MSDENLNLSHQTLSVQVLSDKALHSKESGHNKLLVLCSDIKFSGLVKVTIPKCKAEVRAEKQTSSDTEK